MNAATLTPDQIARRTGCFGFEFEDYGRRTGGRRPYSRYSKGSTGGSLQLSNAVLSHTHLWGKLIPYMISRRPNCLPEIRCFRGDRWHQSRKWKAFFYNERHSLKTMPMRRFEFIGIYDANKPQAWKHPFSPYDQGFVTVDLNPRGRGFAKEYAVYRICSRFAGLRHVFNQTENCSSYRIKHTEEFWKSLPGSVGTENAISVIDTSSSMMAYGAHTLADSLGLFYAEHAKGAFHNKFITFSNKPKMMKIRGNALWEKLVNIHNANWGGTTNLEAVYSMLLRLAVRADAGQDEMPSAVVIYSDMEFNRSVTNPYGNLYDDFREAFEQAGYEVPAVVFHNVNCWQMQTPVLYNTVGTALSSGHTTHHMKHRYTQSSTPIRHVLEVLMSERYAPIHA